MDANRSDEVPDVDEAIAAPVVGGPITGAATAVSGAVCAAILFRAAAEAGPESLISQVILGLFVGDFVGGVIHCLLDRTPADTPVIGGLTIPAKVHHSDPEAMSRNDYRWYHHIGYAGAAALPVLLLVLAFAPPWIAAFAAVVIASLVLTNLTHVWMHPTDEQPIPAAVQTLQKLGLIISPEGHDQHHKNLGRNYATFNGWSNGLLNTILDAVGL